MSIYLLLNFFLLYFSHIKFSKSEKINFLSENTIPHFYSIQLNPYNYDGINSFVGNSSIKFQVLKSTKYVSFHKSRNILIDKEFTEIIDDKNGTIHNVIEQWWYPISEFYSVEMENLLPVGNYSLKLRWNYYNYSQETGLFRVMNYNKSSTPTYLFLLLINILRV